MGWTAPASGSEFAVGEVVTAAKLNTKVGDNLRYLKGLDGALTLDNGVTVYPTSGNGYVALRNRANTNYSQFQFYDDANNAKMYIGYIGSSAGLGARNDTVEIGTVNVPLVFQPNVTEAARFDTSGRFGLGTTAPQGKLHGYDTISGFVHYKFDGVDGTARTIIPDGTGDVLYVLTALYVVRASDGTVAAGSGNSIIPGTSANIYSAGANTLALAVAANGSVTVQRTGGSLTYKVGLWLLWL